MSEDENVLVPEARSTSIAPSMNVVDRSQSVFYFVPRTSQAGSTRMLGLLQPTSIFTRPRCLWGPVYGSRCLYVTQRLFENFTDVTLADVDTNSILANDANRAIWG